MDCYINRFVKYLFFCNLISCLEYIVDIFRINKYRYTLLLMTAYDCILNFLQNLLHQHKIDYLGYFQFNNSTTIQQAYVTQVHRYLFVLHQFPTCEFWPTELLQGRHSFCFDVISYPNCLYFLYNLWEQTSLFYKFFSLYHKEELKSLGRVERAEASGSDPIVSVRSPVVEDWKCCCIRESCREYVWSKAANDKHHGLCPV